MERNLDPLTLLEVHLSSSLLFFDEIQPKIIQPVRLAGRLCVFAFPASLLAAQSPLLLAFLLLCFITAPFRGGLTQENIKSASNYAIASGLWLAAVLLFHKRGSRFALVPLNKLISRISSYPIYWIFHYTLWTYAYFARRPSFLILRLRFRLRWVVEWLRLFGAILEWLLISPPLSWILFYPKAPFTKLVQYCVVKICRKQEWTSPRVDTAYHRNGWPGHYFRHEPLKSPGFIRLLLLHPRHPWESVKCSVIETSLDKAPRYEAISYTWGHHDLNRTVHINKGQFRVTRHAYNLLKNRSSFWFPRLLWIDSICIDQNNLDDKKQQIKLMGDIYRRAFVVSICLELRFQAKDFPEEFCNTVDAHVALDILAELRLKNADVEESTILKSIAGSRQNYRWDALTWLMQNPWFVRIWVVQEAALATSLRICYGKRTIPWQVLMDGLTSLAKHFQLGPLLEWSPRDQDGRLKPKPPNGFLSASQMNGFRNQIQSQHRPTFSQILLSCHRFLATKKQDKIYGILGMCSARHSDLLSPGDYEAPVADVYLNSARCVLREESISPLLSIAGIGYFPSHTDDMKELPTWVPDWSRSPTVTALANVDPKVDYSAGGSKVNAKFRQDGRSLLVHGRVIDRIDTTGAVLSLPTEGNAESTLEEISVLGKALADVHSLLSRSARVPDPYIYVSPVQPLDESFSRILIGDRSPSERPASRSFLDHVRGWEQRIGFMSQGRLDMATAVETMFGTQSERMSAAASLRLVLMRGSMGRKFCASEKGYIGLVPPFAQKGDFLCVVLGVQTPLVMRRLESTTQEQGGTRYHLVGEAYIHGLMDGEALALERETEFLEIA